MRTKVVHIKDGYDVYLGRAGKGHDGYFGNPFVIGEHGSRTDVIEKFKEYFYRRIATDEEFKRRVLELKGKRLGCFCAPQKCHGDIIVEFLESKDDEIS